MLEIQDLQKTENKIRDRYSKLSTVFFVVAILFILLVVIIALFIFEEGPNWAFLSLEHWIFVCCILIVFFIILDLFFYYQFLSIKKKILMKEKPEPEFIDGKRLYVFTYPKNAKGGIYSKTYIDIGENNILRLRSLMIPPGELWSETE